MSDAPFPFDLVGFDLDGTLFDTSDELTISLNHALATIGRPALAQPDVRPMVGLGAKHMLHMGLEASGKSDERLVDELLPILVHHYETHIGSGSPAFPGLIEAMDRLEGMGVRFGIVTNKYERLAVKLIEAKGLSHRFGAILGGDSIPGKRKPDRAPIDAMIAGCGAQRAVFIGDSIYDTKAARHAGIPSVAVSFGFLTQPVGELGADAVIDHYDELVPALQRLG